MKEKDKATNTGRMDEGKREKKKRRAKISPAALFQRTQQQQRQPSVPIGLCWLYLRKDFTKLKLFGWTSL